MLVHVPANWCALDCSKKTHSISKRLSSSWLQFYKVENLDIWAFSDANWSSCLEVRRSASAFCIFIGDNLLFWHFGKYKVVLCSSMEFKYKTLASIAFELLWIQSLCKEVIVLITQSLIIYCDNLNAKALAQNLVFRIRMKIITLCAILF